MNLTNKSRELVTKHGGVKAFCEITGTPESTAKDWSRGKTSQPKHTVTQLDWSIQKGYDVRFQVGDTVSVKLNSYDTPVDVVIKKIHSTTIDAVIKCHYTNHIVNIEKARFVEVVK